MIVKVSDDVPPTGIDAGAKLLEILGGRVARPTVSVAPAVLPVPPLVEVTADVVLVLLPAVVPVTLIENVQLVFAARVAPERLTLPLPAVAVMVPPPHEPVRPLGVATESPAGNGSLNATPGGAAEAVEWGVGKGRGE